jgi:hypothetical protein
MSKLAALLPYLWLIARMLTMWARFLAKIYISHGFSNFDWELFLHASGSTYAVILTLVRAVFPRDCHLHTFKCPLIRPFKPKNFKINKPTSNSNPRPWGNDQPFDHLRNQSWEQWQRTRTFLAAFYNWLLIRLVQICAHVANLSWTSLLFFEFFGALNAQREFGKWFFDVYLKYWFNVFSENLSTHRYQQNNFNA